MYEVLDLSKDTLLQTHLMNVGMKKYCTHQPQSSQINICIISYGQILPA